MPVNNAHLKQKAQAFVTKIERRASEVKRGRALGLLASDYNKLLQGETEGDAIIYINARVPFSSPSVVQHANKLSWRGAPRPTILRDFDGANADDEQHINLFR